MVSIFSTAYSAGCDIKDITYFSLLEKHIWQ